MAAGITGNKVVEAIRSYFQCAVAAGFEAVAGSAKEAQCMCW